MKLLYGERIRELRIRQGMSQKAFADKLGVSEGKISAWENYRYRPSVYIIYKICKIFGVSCDYLLGLKN